MSDTKKTCIVCGERFSYPWLLIKHFETHKNSDGQPHMCPECELPFSTNESFLIHLSRAHCDHNTPEYNCSRCDGRFMSESARNNHEKRNHESTRINTTPTLTANVKLKQQRTDESRYATERFSNPLEGSIINAVTDRIEHPFSVESVNPTVPFDPFGETKHQLTSFGQNSKSSVLSRNDAFNDAFLRGLCGEKNPSAISQSIQEQYSEQHLHSSTHSPYAALDEAIVSSLSRDQNAQVISQVQGELSEQNLHSGGRSSLQASSNRKASHQQLCRAPSENRISIIDQSRRQYALPSSLFQGQSSVTHVSTAEPFAGQFFPSSSFASQTQVSSCQHLGTTSTTSASEQRIEAIGTGIAEHGNPHNTSRGLPFYKTDKHVQPFNQIQPLTMDHNLQLGELSAKAGSKIQAITHQPIILPLNDITETRSTVGATFDSYIPEEGMENGVFNSSVCSLLDKPYDSWMVENSRTKPLNNQENMEQSHGQTTTLTSSTQGQVLDQPMPTAGPSSQNVDTSTGIISYQTQEASFLTSMPCENNKETGRENADSVNPLDDPSSTLDLSFLDDIQIAPPPDQIESETVDNYKMISAQTSHASHTDPNIQQTRATSFFADTDLGSYGISEQSSSSSNVTSVFSGAIHDPLETCLNRSDGTSSGVLTQFKNGVQNEDPLVSTAVTEDNSPAFQQERPTHQNLCKLCNKLFSRKQSLNYHNMRFHSGVTAKPFQCHICPKIFMYKKDVERHVVHAHGHIRPYNCPNCEHKSKTKANLRSHLKTHENNRKRFKCSICGKEYSRKNDLNRHLDRWHRSLNIQGNAKSDGSQNVSNSCGNVKQNLSEASGGTVGFAPGNNSREIYHSNQGEHATDDHSTTGPGPWSLNFALERRPDEDHKPDD